eukprot:COSAG01_NODE_1913_length_8922_cov_30.042049_5_plen_69_part_00
MLIGSAMAIRIIDGYSPGTVRGWREWLVSWRQSIQLDKLRNDIANIVSRDIVSLRVPLVAAAAGSCMP